MAEDWLVDVRKYAGDAEENVVQAIVRYCGIALQSRDGQLVAMSDKKERETVRENFLKKKLGLTHSDAELDAAVVSVGEVMKADRTKNRVTVYYLLAEKFGLLSVFGGAAAGASALGAAGAAGVAAMAMGGMSAAAAEPAPATPAAEPMRAASTPDPVAAPVATYDGGDSGGGGMGWLKWLILAALLLALLFFGARYCANQNQGVSADTQTVSDENAATPGADIAADANATADTTADATATPPVAAPAGSGVVAGEKAGKPMLTVYFDSGKSEVSKDLSTAASSIKDYVTNNANAVLSVSGYNDPTGNAAQNAELSKKRAQNVTKALKDAGISAAIELIKPADSTDASVDKNAARRVEVTVQ